MDRITAEKILESDYDIIVLGSGVAGLAAQPFPARNTGLTYW